MNIRLLFISIVLFIGCISCEQVVTYTPDENKKEDLYCINYVKGSPDSILLTLEELNLAKSLFEFNNLDYSQLQFYRINGDQLGYHHVRCNQYVNGLRIFTGEVFFHFKPNNTYYSISGDVIPQIDLDTLPTMSTDSVVQKFLDRIDKDDFYKNSVYALKLGCYDLEFGYYDLNAHFSADVKKYTKAWKVNFKGREYPYAYINDNTTAIIYYDNGVRY